MDQKQVEQPSRMGIPFWKLLGVSIRTYQAHFLNYFILGAITYIPFLIIDAFSTMDLMDLMDFFHGNFLDILVFLTLPTLVLKKRVFPFATLQLFSQNFFASAVIISFIQLGTLFFFLMFFAQLNFGLILLGTLPYIFLLFAGFYLILHNDQKLISITKNIQQSIQTVKSHFSLVFWNFLNITILLIAPVFFFSMWYLSNHTELLQFTHEIQAGKQQDLLMGQRLMDLLQSIVLEPGFRWGRVGIHLLLRPIKALFLAYLFVEIMKRIAPGMIFNFLGPIPTPESPKEQPTSSPTPTKPEDQGEHE
ncbi:MAG: hypothetical protein COB67_11080 [SAR324 cluster bacterium]|uniref:Uncharacterized protein n=1 Tax=SAR324 cluster bacterium TaxID=2024889 RepID=A0A2A4SUS2_9DELT|nr:MAG: hypothetical protein COB67_11080 [SAR324 cluster bacterium]